MQSGKKVPVTRRAVEHRIKRALAKKGQTLKSCRQDTPAYAELGSLYVVDGQVVIAHHCTIEALADEMELLKPFEVIA